MKKYLILIITAFILFLMVFGINAKTIRPATVHEIQAPQSPSLPVDDQTNVDLRTAFSQAVIDANTSPYSDIHKYDDMSNMAIGFIYANVYTTHAATLNGYQNYKLYAFSMGFMMGEQFISYNPGDYSFEKIESDVRDDGDTHAGLAGSFILNGGYHAKEIMPGLYGSIKLGKGKYGINNVSSSVEYYQFDSTTLGVGLNYSLIDPSHMVSWLPFSSWRGISVGTGLIYQRNKIIFDVNMNPIYEPLGVSAFPRVVVDTKARFNVDVTTYTIPLDIVTSVQPFSILNLTAGAGMDIVYGNSSIVIEAIGGAWAEGISIPADTTPGIISIDGATKDVQVFTVLPRIMLGIGMNIGEAKVDVPFIYYFGPRPGASIGLTAGYVY